MALSTMMKRLSRHSTAAGARRFGTVTLDTKVAYHAARIASPQAPKAERQGAAPPSLRDHPLYETMLSRGAFFKPEMPDADMQYPAWFDPKGLKPKWDPKQTHGHEWHDHVMAEMQNTIDNAAIVHDVYGKLEVTGPKAREFLSRIGTCVIPKEVGQCRMGYVLRRDGMLIGEFVVATRGENDFYFCGQLGYGVYEMNMLIPLREELGYTEQDVHIENVSWWYELLHVPGPKAQQVIGEVLGKEFADVPLFKSRTLMFDGIPIDCLRMSFTGMPGWELHLPAEHSKYVYDKICDHPAAKAAGLKPHGLLAVAGLRIEKFYRISADVKDLSHYKEASIDQFVSKKKRGLPDGFHGIDESFEPKQEYVHLAVDTKPGYEWSLTFAPKSPVMLNGEQIGHTTSAAVGGISKVTHACTLLYRRGMIGKEVSVQVAGQEFPAKVLAEPMVPNTSRD